MLARYVELFTVSDTQRSFAPRFRGCRAAREFRHRNLSHTSLQRGLILRIAGSYLQSNLLKDSHSIEPWSSLLNLRIALHFIGFEALRRIVSTSAVFWLIVDPRRGAGAEVGFSSSVRARKNRGSPSG
jgi:hypothetical protein